MNTYSEKPTWTYCPDPSLQVNSVAISDDGTRCVYGTSNEFDGGVFSTYFCDGNGKILWSAPVSNQKTYQGVFWTAVSADGKYVASGGEHSKKDGFLKAYEGESGKKLLDISLTARINQVSLSKDGTFMAVCYGSTVAVFQLSADKNSYTQIFTETLAYNINSCEISREGNRIIASGINYIEEANSTKTEGMVFSYNLINKTVSKLGECKLTTGCMRVAVTSSGYNWAASLHDGSCVLIDERSPSSCRWQLKPENFDIGLAYAVDVTETDSGEIYVACGANAYGDDYKGLLYLVSCEKGNSEIARKLEWTAKIQLAVNPGVSLDKNAKFVTATDGKPNENNMANVTESDGSFYLFNGSTGGNIWQYKTKLMNWPMMLSYDGNSVFGGSDDGSVYYWNLTQKS